MICTHKGVIIKIQKYNWTTLTFNILSPMKTFKILQLAFLLITIVSCEKESLPETIHMDSISGFVQKGPYVNGTDIQIAELTHQLHSTGKIFSSQIIDNKGKFQVSNIELESPFAELKANGFYFDEVLNQNSAAQLTLYALADISQTGDLNINILSTLEMQRVRQLTATGREFADAKAQAQSEVLSIFELADQQIAASEHLDISQDGDGNARLLALSVIMQGYLPVADLSQLIADISSDIREDGELNDADLGTVLINNARTIKPEIIRENMENKYEALGHSATVPDFETYINQFIENTSFEFTAFIDYPQTGQYGDNILDKERTENPVGDYSMKAVLPEGTSLRVKIQGQSWSFRAFQENTGWSFGDWNMDESSRIFTSSRTGILDMQIRLEGWAPSDTNKVTLFVYENDAIEPTWSKLIEIQSDSTSLTE